MTSRDPAPLGALLGKLQADGVSWRTQYPHADPDRCGPPRPGNACAANSGSVLVAHVTLVVGGSWFGSARCF